MSTKIRFSSNYDMSIPLITAKGSLTIEESRRILGIFHETTPSLNPEIIPSTKKRNKRKLYANGRRLEFD